MLKTALAFFLKNVLCYIYYGKLVKLNIMRREPMVILENISGKHILPNTLLPQVEISVWVLWTY